MSVPPSGFVPPPYPQDRLDALKRTADTLPGGVVDCSVGTVVVVFITQWFVDWGPWRIVLPT